ncbi:MAG: IS1634 family transposase, partial [Thermoanaerobaculum sp.]
MYIREKTFTNKDGSKRTYLQLVEGVRVAGRIKQRVICTLGRLEELQEGQLDRLIEGLMRYSKRQWVAAQAKAQGMGVRWSKEWGPALIFRRLWEELGFSAILRRLRAKTELEFAVEEAVFAMVLNRLLDPGSKRATHLWAEGVYEPGFEQLELHHYYRALDFLAENKEAVEDGWYGRLLDLFRQELDLVFWDTTSTYFEGRGPEALAEYGHSRDHRPDRRQMVIGVLMTRDGYPVAHEVFPGNTADIETFRRVLE